MNIDQIPKFPADGHTVFQANPVGLIHINSYKFLPIMDNTFNVHQRQPHRVNQGFGHSLNLLFNGPGFFRIYKCHTLQQSSFFHKYKNGQMPVPDTKTLKKSSPNYQVQIILSPKQVEQICQPIPI
jgi:hypothetical protein